MTRLPIAMALGLAANVAAELFLAIDLDRPFSQLDRAGRVLRMVRWIACCLGLIAAGALGASLPALAVLALFSVSAATDLETKLLPPDWFVLGSVVAALALAFALGGWPGLRDVAVAQALCFALVTLGVACFRLCEGGDIKLAMQFGAACGSLGMIAVGALGTWLAAAALALTAVLAGAARAPLSHALRRAMGLRPPQGPLLWCGLVLALGWRAMAWA